MRCRASTFAVLCLLCGAAALPAAEIRYDDVIYLDEWKQPALHLKALYRTPITFSRDPRSILIEELFKISGGQIQDIAVTTRNIPLGDQSGWTP